MFIACQQLRRCPLDAFRLSVMSGGSRKLLRTMKQESYCPYLRPLANMLEALLACFSLSDMPKWLMPAIARTWSTIDGVRSGAELEHSSSNAFPHFESRRLTQTSFRYRFRCTVGKDRRAF